VFSAKGREYTPREADWGGGGGNGDRRDGEKAGLVFEVGWDGIGLMMRRRRVGWGEARLVYGFERVVGLMMWEGCMVVVLCFVFEAKYGSDQFPCRNRVSIVH
jgi:hypothetical protein